PVFDPSDAPTTTIGGTMVAIPRASRQHDLAWKLIEFLLFSEEGLRARQQTTDILPPIVSTWDDPFYHRSDPFFGGQKPGELFTALAAQIPPRYATPASPIATLALNDALLRAVDYVDAHGGDDGGLEPACRRWLADSAADLRDRINQWRFD